MYKWERVYISSLCLPYPHIWLLYVRLFEMVIMLTMFLTTDRKAGDPSQAGDQTDGKLKDSKERWVATQYIQGEADSSISLWLVSWFSFCPSHCTHPFSQLYSFILPQLFRLYRLHPTVWVNAVASLPHEESPRADSVMHSLYEHAHTQTQCVWLTVIVIFL